MSSANPCVSCGACCAFFRVSFHWSEQSDGGGTVPDGLTSAINQHLSCMKGTESRPSRCVALIGSVGEQVRCSIYDLRSTTCREFQPSGYGGLHNPDCDRARASWGMPPLTQPTSPEQQPLLPVTPAA
ncbi:MAG: YkgJ family cysteine cluster protein [Hahellaceae bacterium]|nr:YkgJ family cysteine cluster protein [Hahellaceae bacterium]MCP5170558.1 YkgJ family cysteine cluster protein [Hahellaceae bacterium]